MIVQTRTVQLEAPIPGAVQRVAFADRDVIVYADEALDVATSVVFRGEAVAAFDAAVHDEMDDGEAEPTGNEMVAEYARLSTERADLKARDAAAKARMEALTQPIMDYFAEAEVQAVKAGGRTISIRRELWAKREDGVEAEDVYTVLASIPELKDYATTGYNTSTLSAWMREAERNGEVIPEALLAVVKPVETFKLASRKAGK